jgi:hypothetical protein
LVSLALGPTFACQLSAQSFSQIATTSPNVGLRFTQSDAQQLWSRVLFSSPADIVGYFVTQGTTTERYAFFGDSAWNRLLFGQGDNYLKAFAEGGSDQFGAAIPVSMDASPNDQLVVAERGTGSESVLSFNSGTQSLALAESFGLLTLSADPVAVAWDGSDDPLGYEGAYVLQSNSKVSYWKKTGGTWGRLWEYGSAGSGTGQFNSPTGVCVGHSASSPTGTSYYTNDFYVADAGNNRMVRLERNSGSSTPAWKTVPAVRRHGPPEAPSRRFSARTT